MAEVRSIEDRRRKQRWLVAAGLIAAALSILLVYGWQLIMPARQDTPPAGQVQPLTGKYYDPANPAAKVVTQDTNVALAPKGAPEALPAAEMVVVGISQEGYIIYSHPREGNEVSPAYPYGGGGGGAAGSADDAGRAVPGAPGPLYLKTVDGQFVPLIRL